ncbi:hypothetical protein BH09PSE5_BH09PSE5_35160 [soil metagenome]
MGAGYRGGPRYCREAGVESRSQEQRQEYDQRKFRREHAADEQRIRHIDVVDGGLTG